MTIEIATPQTVAIRAPVAELSAAQAREAVRRALRERGLAAWPNMEIALFSSETEVLIIARPIAVRTRRFRFACFEDLAAALACCPEDAASDVVYIAGGFELLLRAERFSPPNALFEFGEELPCTPELAAHIAEHGDMVAEENAVATLQRYFC